MRSKKTILVAGGDLRYGYTARMLAEQYDTYAAGFTRQILPFESVRLAELTDIPMCDVLVLPMPVSDDGVLVNAPFSPGSLPVETLIGKLRPGALVLGGRFGKAAEAFAKAGIETADYLAREELSTMNAVPTAEGAVQIMLEEMPCTLYGSKVMVLGFGRIGSRLAAVLHALGAEVTVAARGTADLVRAEILGCRALPLTELAEKVGKFDAVCNTIPAKVITRPVLEQVQPGKLVLDLASKPGGVDWDAAQELGTKVVWALSLPGKTAPVTAGEMIARTICNMLGERGLRDA